MAHKLEQSMLAQITTATTIMKTTMHNLVSSLWCGNRCTVGAFALQNVVTTPNHAGRHRWVIYKDLDNLDSCTIPPEWHSMLLSVAWGCLGVWVAFVTLYSIA